MKKLLITAAMVAMIAPAAYARTDVAVGLNLGGPAYYPAPVYYEPAPVYYAPPPQPVYYPYGYARHYNYDWGYWHDRRDDDGWRDKHGRWHHR